MESLHSNTKSIDELNQLIELADNKSIDELNQLIESAEESRIRLSKLQENYYKNNYGILLPYILAIFVPLSSWWLFDNIDLSHFTNYFFKSIIILAVFLVFLGLSFIAVRRYRIRKELKNDISYENKIILELLTSIIELKGNDFKDYKISNIDKKIINLKLERISYSAEKYTKFELKCNSHDLI